MEFSLRATTAFSLLLLICLVSHTECQEPISDQTIMLQSSHQLQSTEERSAIAREIYLGGSSVLYGLLKQLNESSVTEICKEQLQIVYNGINQKDVWAIKVLDSSAQFGPGFVYGNNFLLGSLKECESFKKPNTVTLSKRFPRNMKTNLVNTVGPFDLEYNVVYAKHDSPWQIRAEFYISHKILQIGLCLPKSCSSADVLNLTQNYFDRATIGFTSEYEFHPEVVEAKTLESKINYLEKTSVQLLGAVLFITFLLSMLSNIFQRDPENASDAKKKETSLLAAFLKCFSIKDNYRSILSRRSSPDSVPTVNAIKSIGCYMILMNHIGFYTIYSVHNPITLFANGEKPAFNFICTLPIIVDMFFTISGLLHSYNFLENKGNISMIQRNTFWQNCKLFLQQLFHRYLRLTPLYLFVILFTEITTTYIHETSPLWIVQRNDLTCRSHWWRNILYIHTLYPLDEVCLSWVWSVACEMHFFIFFTLLLFLYAKYPDLTKKIFLFFFVSFFLLTYYLNYTAKYEPAYDIIYDTAEAVYLPSWARTIPYFVGVASGWFLANYKHTLDIDKKSSNYLFFLAVSTIIATHSLAGSNRISYIYLAPILTLFKLLYSAATAWIILASTSKNGVPFLKFLNHRFFVHSNKLSYGIYLINPVVISIAHGLRDHSEHFNTSTMTVMYIGVSAIVYLVAIVISLLFEVPYTNLSSLIKKYQNNKNKQL